MKEVFIFSSLRASCLPVILALLMIPFGLAAQSIRYVDASRSSGNGLSWANAYPTLKQALDEANAKTEITEIRVAKGTYYPTGEQSGDNRDATFGIYRRNLAILGGYPTGGVGSRNWDANPTILSGEINNPSLKTDNSHHVVVVAGQLTPETGDLLIEGFRIHWGRADGGGEMIYNGQGVKRNAGGGIAIVGLMNAAWFRVRNCIVSGNYAGDVGAGVYIRNTNMYLLGSLISGNYANYGGGVFVNNTAEELAYRQYVINCTIVGNHANNDAGGFRISGENTEVSLQNTVIYNNTTPNGRKEYISIKDGATYSDHGCFFEWRDNYNPFFKSPVPPGTVTIEGEYWTEYERASWLTENGIENIYVLGDLDLKCNPRRACILDIGAYEFPKHPKIIQQPQSASICYSQDAAFSVTLEGATPENIRWEEKKAGSNTYYTVVDNEVFSGANTLTLTLRKVPYDRQGGVYKPVYDGSTFRCVMWNDACATVISNEVVLRVGQPMEISLDPTSQTQCAGGAVTFRGDALNGSSFQWEYNDGNGFKNVPATSNYSGTTTKELRINSVTDQMNGYQFRLKVNSTCSGVKTTQSAGLTVQSISSISQQPVAQAVCAGAAADFSVQATGSFFQWEYNDGTGWKTLFNTGAYSGVNSQRLSINPVTGQMNSYKYRVKVSGPCNQVFSSDASLTVKPNTAITTPPADQVVCAGSSATFSVVTANASTYRWQYNDGSGFKDVPNTAPYSGVTTSQLQISAVTGAMDHYDYRVLVSGECGSPLTSASGKLTVNLPVEIIQEPTAQNVCSGSSAVFSVLASNAKGYQWQYNDGSGFKDVPNTAPYSGITTSELQISEVKGVMNNYDYRVLVSGECEPAVTSVGVKLTVRPGLGITQVPTAQVVCAGGSASFSVSASQSTGYQWQYDDGSGFKDVPSSAPYSGTTAPTLQISAATVAMNNYSFQVVVSGDCGSIVSTPVGLGVMNTPSPTAPSPQLMLPGTRLSDLNVTGSNLKWYDSADGVDLLSSSTLLESRKYYVSQTLDDCESTRLEIDVTVFSNIRYVKQGAEGSGSSWEDASGDLQAMIDAPGVAQVWVAGGTYKPITVLGGSSDPRNKSFVLKKGVKVYGGFAGTELTLEERDLTLVGNRSVLSGDLGENDQIVRAGGLLNIENQEENAYHVVIAAGDVDGAVLDGFTIRGGNANSAENVTVNGDTFPSYYGGGVFARNTGVSEFEIRHLVIEGNYGRWGGGIYLESSSPLVENVVVKNNLAETAGGVYNINSSARLNHLTIAGNRAITSFHSLVNWVSAPVIKNSIVTGGPVVTVEGAPSYSYSIIQGLAGDETNLDFNQLFWDPERSAEHLLFVDPDNGDYRLQPCSPAVNAGDPNVTGGIDVDGNPRVQFGRVDIGAYESNQELDMNYVPLVAEGSRIAIAYQVAGETTWYASDCNNLILAISGIGESSLSGNMRTRVWVQPTPGYVGRHYEISPWNNPSIGASRVTLYYTQEEFAAYNQPNKPNLPTGPTDQTGIANLRILKLSGVSNNGNIEDYWGEPVVINPNDEDIVWNAAMGRWEVTFDVTGFSGFFAYAVEDAALPVTLVSFRAEAQEKQVRLTWQTTEEQKADRFEIERSADGRSWAKVQEVIAAGEGRAMRDYLALDRAPLAGLNYYRLKMVDLDGTYTYSEMVSVLMKGLPQLTWDVYPNPASEGRVVVSHTGSDSAELTLYDLQGTQRKVTVLKHKAGEAELDVRGLSSGVYLLRIREGASSLIQRLIISK